jgi:eukaryotic-like serine/threonine-protein kinase
MKSLLQQFHVEHWFARLTAFFALAGVFFYVFAFVALFRFAVWKKDFGWEAQYSNGKITVSSVDARGSAADKLRKGDQILSFNGDRRIASGARLRSLDVHRRATPNDAPYRLLVSRDGREREVTLTATLTRTPATLAHVVAYLFVGLSFFALALTLGFFKPEEPMTRIASLASLGMAALPYYRMLEPLSVFFNAFELSVFYSAAVSYPIYVALAFHFYYRFPSGVPSGKAWSLGLVGLYVVGLPLFLGYRILDVVSVLPKEIALDLFERWDPLFKTFETATNPYQLIGLAAAVAVIVRNYWRVAEPDQRRRIAWVVYGTVAGITPFGALVLFEVAAAKTRFAIVQGAGWYEMLVVAAEIAPMVIAVTIGYAIIRHRLFDVRVIIRRGLQYVFARGLLVSLIWLPVAWLVVQTALNPNQTVSDAFIKNPAAIALIACAAPLYRYRLHLQRWLDRKFFREAYDSEQVLVRLIAQMKQRDSLEEISDLVRQEVDAALHPKSLFLYYRERDTGGRTLYCDLTGASAHCVGISENSQTLRYMEAVDSAQEFPFPKDVRIEEVEAQWMTELGVNLVVPMNGKDGRLIGLFLLGEKKSEEPYAGSDRRLLQTIGSQIAVVYENSRLRERVERDRKVRLEVLARLDEQNVNLVKECPQCGKCYDATANICPDDYAELTLSLPVERIVEGKYRLDRLLGKGGMGAVYECQDIRLNRKVALKVILGSLFGDQVALRRFEREARASAALQHQNIIAIYDYGRTGAEGAYLVMELVPNLTMRDYLKRHGVLDSNTAAEWFFQLCEGVKTAHAAGIVHRDLKPENVLVANAETSRPTLKILDFGLAKVRSGEFETEQTITKPGLVMGTLGYMSPEQIMGDPVDERSDVFALGVMAVEALTGKLPFPRRTFNEYLLAVTNRQYRLPDTGAEVRRLDAVIQRCLAKEPAKRFASVADMQRELIPAIRACPSPLGAEPPAPSSGAAYGPDAETLIG